jgi:pimeloyl-ACP methyl ester carboxylesterase
MYDTTKWQPLCVSLQEKGYEPVVLQVPGLTSPLDHVWTLDDYVAWLSESLPTEPVILLGHSNGGRISLAFSAAYPNRVSKLILIGSAGVYDHRILSRLKRGIFASAAKVGKRLTSSPTLRRLMYRLARVKDYNQASPVMKETMRNMISLDLVPKLSKITMPTLLIWGALDNSTPLREGRILAQGLPSATLVVISVAGHSSYATHPKEVLHYITDFISHANL